jgi:hypothetical protein
MTILELQNILSGLSKKACKHARIYRIKEYNKEATEILKMVATVELDRYPKIKTHFQPRLAV